MMSSRRGWLLPSDTLMVMVHGECRESRVLKEAGVVKKRVFEVVLGTAVERSIESRVVVMYLISDCTCSTNLKYATWSTHSTEREAPSCVEVVVVPNLTPAAGPPLGSEYGARDDRGEIHTRAALVSIGVG